MKYAQPKFSMYYRLCNALDHILWAIGEWFMNKSGAFALRADLDYWTTNDRCIMDYAVEMPAAERSAFLKKHGVPEDDFEFFATPEEKGKKHPNIVLIYDDGMPS